MALRISSASPSQGQWSTPEASRPLARQQVRRAGPAGRQPLVYQGRCCLLRIGGRKILPAPSLVAGP